MTNKPISYKTIRDNQMLTFPEGAGVLNLEQAKAELGNVHNGQAILKAREGRLLTEISKLEAGKIEEQKQQDRREEEVRATAVQKGVPSDDLDDVVCRCGRKKEKGERLCIRCEEMHYDALMDAVEESKEAGQ